MMANCYIVANGPIYFLIPMLQPQNFRMNFSLRVMLMRHMHQKYTTEDLKIIPSKICFRDPGPFVESVSSKSIIKAMKAVATACHIRFKHVLVLNWMDMSCMTAIPLVEVSRYCYDPEKNDPYEIPELLYERSCPTSHLDYLVFYVFLC